MGKSLINFTKDSYLFQKKSIENQYSRFSDSQIENELERYREFCLEYATQKQTDKQNLNVLIEGSNNIVNENFLKQTALYIHQIIINDPVFDFSLPRNDSSRAINQYLGMKNSGINREKLSKASRYIVEHTNAVNSGFIDFLPLSYLHEPPKEIPVNYSKVLFSDILPKELLSYFWENAKVIPIQRIDGHWIIDPKAPLAPCRAIDISFSNDKQNSFSFMLFDTQVTEFDEETGFVKFAQILSETPPSKEDFENWVTQSINQASRRNFDRVYKEITLANSLGTNYLTQSEFIYQLLHKSTPLSSDIETDVLNLMMGIDLPLLENVTLEHILDIREKDGEAFENFRVELEKHLRELRAIKDPSELEVKLENTKHELTSVQIREINKKISKVKNKMFPDAIILVAGLVTTIQTNGWALPALIYAIQNGYKTYQEYVSEVKQNPTFFLWKVVNK